MSDYGIKTYTDLAETCCGIVLANEIAIRPLEPVSGDWAPWDEIFQWNIVQDPSFLMEHTDEPEFYDAERPGAQAEQFRRFVRRHVTGLRPLHLLLFFSHISHIHVQNPFCENKKAPVETKEGHRQNMPCLSRFPRELRVRYFARDARPIRPSARLLFPIATPHQGRDGC